MTAFKIPVLVTRFGDLLQQSGLEEREARSMARQLVAHRLGVAPKELIMHLDRELEADDFRDDLNKLAAGIPLQHVLGETGFMGLTFKCSPAAHVPRLDSEPLVECAIELMRTHPEPIIADVCCGAGTYGLSLARYLPKAQVALTDLSAAAIELARENARLIGVEDRCGFASGDLFAPLAEAGIRCDLIAVNPPYVPTEQIASLPPQVRCDPLSSLDGGNDGLFFYRRIVKEVPPVLADHGWLLLEHGEEQQEAVCRLLEQQGFEVCVRIPDYGHRDRGLLARLKEDKPLH
ncbi:MAG: peptide chain release factor N(5)-glutamine methyltransferase [Firmicutes bacterium]|nr:peptide chain release factor N(5)-glutamine methyltransferase [Bacillota bacterium]